MRPASDLAQNHRGGTLKLTASAAAGTIDPHINYQEKFNQLYAFLFDGLVTFRKTGGAAGGEVVADLAEALPQVRRRQANLCVQAAPWHSLLERRRSHSARCRCIAAAHVQGFRTQCRQLV